MKSMYKKFKDLQKKKGKKGFSMIELIIVIAIMAILIALIGTQLLPYLEKSRRSKDLTTLDTCLTNFQSALASCEYSSTGKTVEATGIAQLDTKFVAGVADAYKEVAGAAYDEDSELQKAFKSKAAKGQTVIFGVDANGVCYVKVSNQNDKDSLGLYVSPSYSGTVKAMTNNNNNNNNNGGGN